jgi:hypothetical protein
MTLPKPTPSGTAPYLERMLASKASATYSRPREFLVRMIPAGSHKPISVWYSTATSAEANAFSVLAATEVLAAIALYWALAMWLRSHAHLWISLIVAPLLLLRSEASIALGVRWFEQYVDDTFNFTDLPQNLFRSLHFWIALFVALGTTSVAAYFLASFWAQGQRGASLLLIDFVVGYAATQLALAATVAVSARGVVAFTQRRTDTAIVGAALTALTGIGVAASGSMAHPSISAALAALLLTFVGVLKGPVTLAAAMNRVRSEAHGDVRGIAIMRAALETAPLSIAIFAPGFYLGGWIRSVGTRIAATTRHLLSGILAMPDNWWRTLFVIDFLYPPELIPGYKRPDFFTSSHFLTRIKQSDSLIERFVCIVALTILYVPGYLYRLSIKSTCWFYLPLVYITRAPWLATKPALLSDILWRDLREWWRRVLAVATVCGVFLSTLAAESVTANLPARVISPLEYMFLIDLTTIKPWQWFNLISAAITIGIFAYVGRFKMIVYHLTKDHTLAQTARRYALLLEYAMRLRNVSTFIFFLIAAVHTMLWLSPIKEHLPRYLLNLLRSFYGTSMP